MATLIRSADISSIRRVLGDEPHIKCAVAMQESPKIAGMIESDADRKLTEANARALDAESQLREILKDIDSIRHAASEEGYAIGYEEGIQAGNTALKEQKESMQRLLDSLADKYAGEIAQLDDAIVEIIFSALRKILGEILIEPEAVVASVKQAIKHIIQRDKLVVHISETDMRLLRQLPGATRDLIADRQVELVSDDRVTLGGCIVQTDNGSLDARIEVQLQQLRDRLLQIASQRKSNNSQ